MSNWFIFCDICNIQNRDLRIFSYLSGIIRDSYFYNSEELINLSSILASAWELNFWIFLKISFPITNYEFVSLSVRFVKYFNN